MNINFMETYYQLRASDEAELMVFASQVKTWKESGVLSDDTFDKCKAYAERIQSDICALDECKERFMKCVNSLVDFRSQQVITQRHIYNKKWDDVAESMGLSSQHIQKRIYPAAVKEMNMLLAIA